MERVVKIEEEYRKSPGGGRHGVILTGGNVSILLCGSWFHMRGK
jgi:hypothetical protein